MSDSPAAEKRTQGILSTLSLVTTPAGVAALVAPALGHSAERVAIIAFLTLIASVVWLWRRRVDRVVTSSQLIGLTLVGAALYFSNPWQNEEAGRGPEARSPVEVFERSGLFLEEPFAQALEQAEHEVWFYGTNFHISAPNRKAELIAALRRGVDLNYLIFDHACGLNETVANNLDAAMTEFSGESIKSLEALRAIREEWRSIRVGETSDFEVRLYCEVPLARAYLFDPETEGQQIYLVPYVHRVNSAISPGFLSSKGEGPFGTYIKGIRSLWHEATPLDEWVAK